MKKAFLLIAATMFVFVGCQKGQSEQKTKSNDIIHIKVNQMGPATKVAANDITADPLTFKWEEGDEVGFWDEHSGTTTYKCTNPTTNEFEYESGAELDPDGKYMVVYPVSYLESNEIIRETYRSGQIPAEHVIYTEGVSGSARTFYLDEHSTIIHLQLTGDAKIGSIEYQVTGETKSILSCGKDGVQLSDTANDFYIDVMDCFDNEHSPDTETFRLVFKDTDGQPIGEPKSTKYNLAKLSNVIVDFPAIEVNASSAKEPLKGVFTVSAGIDGIEGTDDDVKVRFAKGNLYCKRNSSDSNDWVWGIYEHQYDWNSLNASISQWDDETGGNRTAKTDDTEIDLFTWGVGDWSTSPTTSLYLETPTVGNVLSGNEEWGTKIGDGWRTLTCEELKYIFAKNAFKAGVTVCGVKNCVLIAPDECLNDYSFVKTKKVYSEEEWKTAEEAGILCLPNAGMRQEDKVTYVRGVTSYWTSSSVSTTEASAPIQILGNQLTLAKTDGKAAKNCGYPVRLAKDVLSE